MEKRRVQRTKRATRKRGNLPARTVARVEAAGVVGGEIKQAQPPKPAVKTLSVELMFDT
jgi:hypothetical protein